MFVKKKNEIKKKKIKKNLPDQQAAALALQISPCWQIHQCHKGNTYVHNQKCKSAKWTCAFSILDLQSKLKVSDLNNFPCHWLFLLAWEGCPPMLITLWNFLRWASAVSMRILYELWMEKAFEICETNTSNIPQKKKKNLVRWRTYLDFYLCDYDQGHVPCVWQCNLQTWGINFANCLQDWREGKKRMIWQRKIQFVGNRHSVRVAIILPVSQAIEDQHTKRFSFICCGPIIKLKREKKM